MATSPSQSEQAAYQAKVQEAYQARAVERVEAEYAKKQVKTVDKRVM
jgi:hypothetical protein